MRLNILKWTEFAGVYRYERINVYMKWFYK